MKKIVYFISIGLLVLVSFSCSQIETSSIQNDGISSSSEIENNKELQNSRLLEETSQEYVAYLNKLDEYQTEYKDNPSKELETKIDELEQYGIKAFPDWVIISESNNDDSVSDTARSTYSADTWRNSVKSVGSYGFVTIYWKESFLLADIYKIYRKNPNSNKYLYIGSVTPLNNDNEYFRDYNVSGNTYYSYQVTAYEGNYYYNAFPSRAYVPN